MLPLKVFLFGVPRVERLEESISISRRKTTALLAYLAATGQYHSRDTLAALFWPDYDQSSARANLRRDLSRLKNIVGDEILDVDREKAGLRFDGDLWLDIRAFNSNLEKAKQHQDQTKAEFQRCEECIKALEEAVSLYTDDFLAGFSLPDSVAFDEWHFFQAESLRQSLAEALQQLIDSYVHTGEYKRAIEHARRWLALDALHEPAHRQLMQLYAWSGQHSAALRQFQECERLLADELGIEPEEETVSLHEAIRTKQLPPPPVSPSQAPVEPVKDLDPQNRFIREELISIGGFGELYRGVDQVSGQTVVIKRLRSELIHEHPDYVERFLREREALSQLNHPNIVQMLAAFEQDGQPCLVMEYVPGGTLGDLLSRKGKLPLSQFFEIGLELADALARAHHLGIIHRDIKPENVLLSADGKPLLTDFGVARLKRHQIRLTQTGQILGSPAYMSPEALRSEDLDERSDIWSFGVLMFEMLTGRLPFRGEQITQIITSILDDPVPEVDRIRADIPPGLSELLQRMLAKDRERRIATMRQVAAALEAIQSGRPFTPLTSGAVSHEKSATQEGRITQQTILEHLPKQSLAFVGRERELSEIQDLLADDPACRLLTILGPGGIGKTRLALEIASTLEDRFEHGVFFVPLAGLDAAEHLLTALAERINFRFYQTSNAEKQVLDYLGDKQILLVMDNFEHVLAGTELVSEILQAAPEVKVLVTSRERLNLKNETIYTLSGMTYPEASGQPGETVDFDASKFGAVQLFLQNAKLARPKSEFSAKDFKAAARICRLVQGMPLALVLAASWAELLSFEEIADEISKNLDILESQARDVPSRQRSVRATFDYSWRRLTLAEQGYFSKLSVFRGGFTRHAAQAVAGAGLLVLRSLVNKSLLSIDGEGRYEVHELLRQFGAEILAGSDDADSTRQAHSFYYLHLLHQLEPELKGKGQIEALDQIEEDIENIRSAWKWAIRQRDFATLNLALESLYLYAFARSRYQEGADLLRLARDQLELLDESGMSPAWGRILSRLALLDSLIDAENIGIEADLQMALEIAQDSNDRRETAFSLLALGYYHLHGRRDSRQAIGFFERSLETYEALGDRFYMSRVLHRLGYCYGNIQRIDLLIQHTRRSLELTREIGNKVDASIVLNNLAGISLASGRYDLVGDYTREAIEISRELGTPWTTAHSKAELSLMHVMQGNLEKARERAQESLQAAIDINYSATKAYSLAASCAVEAVAGDFEFARKLGEESLSIPSNVLGVLVASWGLSLAECGLGHYERAWDLARESMKVGHDLSMYAIVSWFLPAAAIVLENQGHKERAAELVGLAHGHPQSATGWIERSEFLSQFIVDLKTELGEDDFEAAWNRGQQREIDEVVAELLAYSEEF